MPQFIRVKCKSTGHEKSIPAESSLEGWEVLKKDAVNPDGTPLPDKHHIGRKAAPESLSSQSTSGQQAEKGDS